MLIDISSINKAFIIIIIIIIIIDFPLNRVSFFFYWLYFVL